MEVEDLDKAKIAKENLDSHWMQDWKNSEKWEAKQKTIKWHKSSHFVLWKKVHFLQTASKVWVFGAGHCSLSIMMTSLSAKEEI